jgi:hypothetical protein
VRKGAKFREFFVQMRLCRAHHFGDSDGARADESALCTPYEQSEST